MARCFPELKARENTAHECNVSPLTHAIRDLLYTHLHPLASDNQQPSASVHIVPASRSLHCVRQLGYSSVVYAKHYSYRSGKRLGWRASGKQSSITSTFRRPAFSRSQLAIITAELDYIKLVCMHALRTHLMKTVRSKRRVIVPCDFALIPS